MEFAGGRRHKQWIFDKAVESWLESWQYKDYLEKATVEFLMLNGCVTVFHGSGSTIEKLEFVSCNRSRHQWPGNDGPITSMITGDFTTPTLSGYERIPIFDPAAPLAHRKSISFEALYQAAVEFYPRSAIHGSLSWITAGSKTADLITAFNANSISPKYHIEVPALYWEKREEKLIAECQIKGIPYKDSMLKALMNQTFEEVANALSGIDNVGKFLVTDLLHDEKIKQYVGWKVTAVEAKVRDYLSAQLKVSHEAQFHVSAGMGMHPALTGMRKSGGLSTGSEFEYAAKLYKQIQTEFAERSIMKSVNAAISFNFKGCKAKLGFNHDEK
jgi:hypothetical protein